MKRFLKLIFLLVFILLLCFVCIAFMADGSADASYKRFTSSKQKSLIVGSSRAAQGLRPSVLNKALNRDDIYNYAFNIVSTPFGRAYYESIDKKLQKDNTDGLFIIEVTPWALSTLKEFKSDTISLRETNTFIDKTSQVNLNPNFEYLIESYQESYIKLITNKYRKGDYQTFYIHGNGWLEVTIVSDMFSREQRKNNKVKLYKKGLLTHKGISQYRLNYLEKTIELFKKYGDVFVVRMPVDKDLLDIENVFTSDFNTLMKSICKAQKINYIDFTVFNDDYNYTDGNHLDIEASEQYSKFVADSITKLINHN